MTQRAGEEEWSRQDGARALQQAIDARRRLTRPDPSRRDERPPPGPSPTSTTSSDRTTDRVRRPARVATGTAAIRRNRDRRLLAACPSGRNVTSGCTRFGALREDDDRVRACVRRRRPPRAIVTPPALGDPRFGLQHHCPSPARGSRNRPESRSRHAKPRLSGRGSRLASGRTERSSVRSSCARSRSLMALAKGTSKSVVTSRPGKSNEATPIRANSEKALRAYPNRSARPYWDRP